MLIQPKEKVSPLEQASNAFQERVIALQHYAARKLHEAGEVEKGYYPLVDTKILPEQFTAKNCTLEQLQKKKKQLLLIEKLVKSYYEYNDPGLVLHSLKEMYDAIKAWGFDTLQNKKPFCHYCQCLLMVVPIRAFPCSSVFASLLKFVNKSLGTIVSCMNFLYRIRSHG